MKTLREIADVVRSGNTSISDLVAEKLACIKTKNPGINALAYVAEDEAQESARALDAQRAAGKLYGRLLGATFSARLSIDVGGMPTSSGSVSEEPKISVDDSFLIDLLKKNGAICLGKGNIAERGRSYFSENPRYGRTNHPVDPSLTPGGSGGGDAAALAAGMIDFAIGADAGGSVRIPANFCGLYALIATHGTLSEGGLAYQSHTITRLLKSPGIFARTRDDLEMLFTLLERYDRSDPYSNETFAPRAKRTGRFLTCKTLNGTVPDPAILNALDAAAAAFERAGFQGKNSTPKFFEEMSEPFVLLAAQAHLLLEGEIARRENRTIDLAREGIHMKALRKRLAEELPALSVENALYQWYLIDQGRTKAAQLFEDIDFILMPVSATLPVPHLTAQYRVGSADYRTEEVFQFSTVVNALGLPAIAVPTAPLASGVPVGFQIVGARHQERALFSFLREAGY